MQPALTLIYAISYFAVVIAFAFAAWLFLWVKRQRCTNERINEISELIKAGANTFIRKEYKVLAVFAGGRGSDFCLFPDPCLAGRYYKECLHDSGLYRRHGSFGYRRKIGIVVATSAIRAAEAAGSGTAGLLVGFAAGR